MPLDVTVDKGVVIPPAIRRTLVTNLRRMVRAAALTEGHKDFEVALRLTTDAGIHELNRDYRAKDKPTDVLAFAQREGPSAKLHPTLLGDIVISVETARRQAKRGLEKELLHLASHGLCHLLGYDHRDDAEEKAMNARASKLRREGARRRSVGAA
jgi:probable rRNA maturation factor